MNSIFTYFVYNSIIISPALFVLFKRYQFIRSFMYYGSLVFIVTLVSIREQVGRDFNNYVSIYYGLKDNDRLELGFQSLIDLLNFLNLPSQSLFFISALIIYGVVFKVFRKTSSYIFIILWFLIFFLPSLNQIRQVMSIAILTYAILHLNNNRLFLFWVLVSTLFHYTGIIGVLFLVFSKIKLRLLWCWVLFTPILAFIKISDLILYLGLFKNSYYYFYLTDQSIYAGQQTLSIGGVFRLTLAFLFIYLYRNDNRYFIAFLKNSLFSYCCLYFLSLNFYILYRIYMPFAIALPFAAYYLFKERKTLVRIFVVFYVSCLFVFFQKNILEQTINPSQGNSIYPYQTIFDREIIPLE